MTPEAALAELRGLADPDRARQMAAYHKVDRPYLGIPTPMLYAAAKRWRPTLRAGELLSLAKGLWDSNIHEARIIAARLLAPARLGTDEPGAWATICGWAAGFDAWALADHACIAARHRLLSHPQRLDDVAQWCGHTNMWTRRAALVITLPWARLKTPDAEQTAQRERILGWAAAFLARPETDWFMQKAVGWWLRDLSRRDPHCVRRFLDEHGEMMRPFARREATRHLP